MTAREMEAMAKRWERERPAPRPRRRTAMESRMDTAYERWKAESGAGCLPCLLEDLE